MSLLAASLIGIAILVPIQCIAAASVIDGIIDEISKRSRGQSSPTTTAETPDSVNEPR